MPDLSTLIERVEALTGPSRDADYRIEKAIVRPGEFPASEIWPPFMVGSKFDRSIPAYTASIDAAVALVERVLPGKSMSMIRAAIDLMYERGGWEGREVQDLLPRYIVLLALRALHAQERRDG